jgi:hypothetical protein
VRSTTEQIFCINQILQGGSTRRQYISCSLTSRRPMSKVLYNILIEVGVPMKLVRLIKMCLNQTCSKTNIGKHLSDNFGDQIYLSSQQA